MKRKANKKNMKICLVGSSGGHLTHLYMLKPFWKDKDRFWVTFDKEDARSILEGEKMYPCYYPTNRSLKALIKNTKIAWKVLRKERPEGAIAYQWQYSTDGKNYNAWSWVDGYDKASMKFELTEGRVDIL